VSRKLAKPEAERIHHLWRGRAFTEDAIDRHLEALADELVAVAGARLPIDTILSACGRLGEEIAAGGAFAKELRESLRATGVITDPEIVEGLVGIAEFLSIQNLELKISRELDGGAPETRDPLDPRRANPREAVFESWAPLGFLVHVASANAFSVGVLSMIEGLLVSNVGFLKLSRADGDFPFLFLRRLVELDPSGKLANYVYAARIGSDETERLAKVFREADGVAAWGGEDGIEGVRKLSPASARFVDWGPKISFAYVSKGALADAKALEEGLRAIAKECCTIEQQACSSPQVVYFEVANDAEAELDALADKLFRLMTEESEKIPRTIPGEMEQAEITATLELAREEACLGLTRVFESEAVRVIVERKNGLRASPLFRSVWVKPLPRERIVETLRPLRIYLQTTALLGTPAEYGDLSARFAQAGVLRVTPPGRMLESYLGEPHDGVYALARYARRLSFQAGESAGTLSRLGELLPTPKAEPASFRKGPILTKEGFQSLVPPKDSADLYFKSGGSTGKAKISVFTYEDYHTQMEFAAEGLRAAGLDPAVDRCMNLFFGGGLYGGFLSFFSILEKLRAVQFPMSAHPDLAFVREIIVEYGVNTLLGMPSSIIQLFAEEGEALKKYGGVKKIFYGGEHFHDLQRTHFRENFGIEIIRSASYGSVDAGPLGFQCEHCLGSIHHLHSGLHDLEVVEFERDAPVKRGEAGRLLVTVKRRRGQAIRRYEIGDTVREVLDPCPCGRAQPRYELLGRHGDVFRVGGMFLNYQKFQRTLLERFGYAHEFQIRLPAAAGADREKVLVFLAAAAELDAAAIRTAFLASDHDLDEAVVKDKALELEVRSVPLETFSRTSGSGKLMRIVDERGKKT
jgi:phenylacetate-coenzyme A ligase PaaK-like adenylate-forming protein